MIAVVGEALIDLLPSGRPQLYRARAGGSPANVAMALGRLGVRTSFYGGLSKDAWGRWIVDLMREAGVETRGPYSDMATPLARVEDAQDAKYRFYLRETAFEAVGWEPLPQGVRALHSGSLAAALPGTAGAVWDLISSQKGVFLSFDPNIRPGVTPTSFREVFWERAPEFDLVKLSSQDLSWLAPDSSPQEAAERLRGSLKWLVVTQGAAGAIAYYGRHKIYQEAPRVRVKDTVGAGDAFMAGLLAWLAHNDAFRRELQYSDIQNALCTATKAAGLTLERSGAQSPTLAEVQARGGEICEA